MDTQHTRSLCVQISRDPCGCYESASAEARSISPFFKSNCMDSPTPDPVWTPSPSANSTPAVIPPPKRTGMDEIRAREEGKMATLNGVIGVLGDDARELYDPACLNGLADLVEASGNSTVVRNSLRGLATQPRSWEGVVKDSGEDWVDDSGTREALAEIRANCPYAGAL